MPKAFRAIVLPLEILKQDQFAKKIQEIDQNISTNTQYLKKFVDKNHEVCNNASKQINKLITTTQKKLNSLKKQQGKQQTKKQEQSFGKFLKDLLEIYQCMESQINRVTILLNSKKHDSMKKLNEVINLKLIKAGESVALFVAMVRQYNTLDQKYIKKAEYFNNIEKDPIKYYSFTKNSSKYKKVVKIQQQLQTKLEAIGRLKDQIRDMMNQIYNKIKELYQNIHLKIEQLKKAIQIILQKIIQLINGFQKIEQVSERAEEQSEAYTKQSSKQKDKGQKLTTRQQIRQIKKQSILEHERQSNFKDIFINFFVSFLSIVANAATDLDKITDDKQFQKFYSEKAFMEQRLPLDTCQDVDLIIENHRSFRNIFSGINKFVTKEVFEEMFKRQKLYYYRFIEGIQKIQDRQIEEMSASDQQQIIKLVKQKSKKYMQQQSQWKKQFDMKLIETINRIKAEFGKKRHGDNPKKGNRKSELFSNKYFQIVKHSYFEHNKVLSPFARLEQIPAYEQIMKSNRLKNILMEIDEDIMIKTNEKAEQTKPKEIQKVKSSCCGLFRRKQKKIDELNIVKKLKKGHEIDHYSCALKNRYFLCQGVIVLYNEYLCFKSSFNPSTLFGATEIFIPKFQIYQFIKGMHFMSEMITVVTKRGSLEFTSFFVNPFDVLVDVYMNNRNTEYDNVTQRNYEKEDQKPELQQLKQKLENNIKQEALKQKFIIKNTKCTVNDKQFMVEYMYSDQLINQSKVSQTLSPNTYSIFRVTIKYYENSLEYVFWHSANNNIQRQKKLQSIAKKIIDDDRVQKCDNFNKQIKKKDNIQLLDDNISFQIEDQVSIIGTKQKHRFDFGEQNVPLNVLSPPGAHSKRNISQVDFIRLMQQNQTKFNQTNNEPQQIRHSNKPTQKQINTDNILSELDNNNPVPFYEDKNNKRIIYQNKQQTQKKSTMIHENSSNIKTDTLYYNKNNNHNHNRSKDRIQASVVISENASTVKIGERYRPPSSNRVIVEKGNINKSVEDQIRIEGIKNLFIMLAIAMCLISIIKVFI